MAVKALIFGIDEIYNELKPFYETAIQRGDIEIVGYAILNGENFTLHPARSEST